jgi:mono/diheme cytochrome c family protein
MMRSRIKHFVLGGLAAYSLAFILFLTSAAIGVLPVQADIAPSRLETNVLGTVLRASVRRAAKRDSPPLVADENLMNGAGLYLQMCSRCHGRFGESSVTYGESFYPPAPHLTVTRVGLSDNEMFWVVKHGIRNTGMPAWGKLVSDDEIWQIVAFLTKFPSLPDSAKVELLSRAR